MPTLQAPIAELKARLSEFIARARGGDEVLITDRGRPVARIVPLAGSDALTGRQAELVRAGLAREPTGPLEPGFLDLPRPCDPDGRSLESILEERAEGW
jgi:prevent-host-death family protein